MGEWQPIETAPKDGSLVLVFQGGEIALARWRDDGWRNNHYGEREVYWYYYGVTHWMPLPSTPAQE